MSLTPLLQPRPGPEYRQVIETNLFGAIYGARAAVAHFRRSNSGILINVSSQQAFGGNAYSSAYAISKYGMRALSDTLPCLPGTLIWRTQCPILSASTRFAFRSMS